MSTTDAPKDVSLQPLKYAAYTDEMFQSDRIIIRKMIDPVDQVQWMVLRAEDLPMLKQIVALLESKTQENPDATV